MRPVPATYKSNALIVRAETSALRANIRELLARQQEFFTEEINTLTWAVMQDGGKYAGEGTTADLDAAVSALTAGVEVWRLTLLHMVTTPNMQLRYPGNESITIRLDFTRRLFGFDASVLGQDRAAAVLQLITRGLELAQVSLPDHHQHLAPFIRRLLADHPNPATNIFLMMRFSSERKSASIASVIRETCAQRGLTVLRADDKEYTGDLLNNVQTYIYGCGSAVAVFEEINYREYNPNVALEVGFVLSQDKPLLLLKDKAMRSLPTDIIGKIYQPFDTYEPEQTIPSVLQKWLNSYGIGKGEE